MSHLTLVTCVDMEELISPATSKCTITIEPPDPRIMSVTG
jgi:hypothetical protein